MAGGLAGQLPGFGFGVLPGIALVQNLNQLGQVLGLQNPFHVDACQLSFSGW